jgi:hypothetical protein
MSFVLGVRGLVKRQLLSESDPLARFESVICLMQDEDSGR